ncbi:MAG: histidine phosphatase family protein [Mariprofundales bacterium]|nr:histidine phosphatase family protein [Mariprofundales bacterium]
MLTIDLLRHGELHGGTKYRGHSDDPLTPKGEAQMDAVWSKLANTVEIILCSPLRRCRQPAEKWAQQCAIPLQIEPRLKELHYGAWEGKTIQQISQTHGDMLRQWRHDPRGMTPPEGESMDDFHLRLRTFWLQLCEEQAGRHVLIVGHSGINRTLLAIALGASLATSRRMQLPYGCWSRVERSQGEVQLAFHNRQP